jgi:lipopolysaccharide export system protein LptA
MFSETSVLTRATRYKVSEDIYHIYCREIIPEDGVLRPYIMNGCTVTVYLKNTEYRIQNTETYR